MTVSKCDLLRAGWTLPIALAIASGPAIAGGAPPPPAPLPQRTLINDGSFVHDAGAVGLNISNWGLLGSMPGLGAPFSHAPSFESPLHSGRNHLWAAGLWIGALHGGVPRVTTGQYQIELASDPDDPLDTIYRSAEGAPGSRRYPDPAADDDADGLEDEDPPNGRDDDLDGAVDEDHAAIGQQDFRCEMRDDSAALVDPDHVSMHLEVVQRSHAWAAGAGAPAIAFQFLVTNRGDEPLRDAYIGMFADFDVGASPEDDLPGFWQGRVRNFAGDLVPISLAFGYDADGDDGAGAGYFGMVLLGCTTDPTGETAPSVAGWHGVQHFRGGATFASGGDPADDSQRYEALAEAGFDVAPTDPGAVDDYRLLASVGPFDAFGPGRTLQLDIAFVHAVGLDGLRRHAADLVTFYNGRWYDRDEDPTTGIKGRERQVCQSDFSSPLIIFDLFQDCVTPGDPNLPPPIQPEDLDAEGCIWINADCAAEAAAGATDCTRDGEGASPAELAGCTGIGGRETHVRWVEPDGSVPTPRGVLRATLRESGVVLQAGVDLLWAGELRIDRMPASNVTGRSWELAAESWSGTNASRYEAGVLDDDVTGWPRRYALVLQHPGRDVVLAEVEASRDRPMTLTLEASPNPFNPRTTLWLTLAAREQVELTVHDSRGRLVRQLQAGWLAAGRHPLTWDGLDAHGHPAASGVYVARATAGARAVARSLTLVR